MLSPARVALAWDAVFTEALWPPPSLSVTSVRCFPPLAWLSHGTPVFHRSALATNPIPLRDLCDLCAMLSPLAWLSQGRPFFTEALWPPTPSLSVTSVTSVRCFPRSRGSRTGRLVFHRSALATNPIPLRDLCDLCAMLSPARVALARDASRNLTRHASQLRRITRNREARGKGRPVPRDAGN